MSSLLNRFLKYVKIDTQSKENVQNVFPSTEKQFNLARLLVDGLHEFGIEDAELDKHGYVYATLPSNIPSGSEHEKPVIGFLAHLDTSPQVSGCNVKPIIHRNYQGGDILYTEVPNLKLCQVDNPDLEHCIGDDIITSNGTTLLGADNKAGIAEIMTLIERLSANPDILHGEIKIGFTPDEEIGNGTRFFDIEKFGADFAYTVDGGRLGEIENENFNAVSAIINIKGISVHPGTAKGKLVNAIRIGSEILQQLANVPAPETTEAREGYIHPYASSGGAAEFEIKFLLRDFEIEGIEEKRTLLKTIVTDVSTRNPAAVIETFFYDSYQNMRQKLAENPDIVNFALKAASRAGIEPRLSAIRGGTDGAKLCQNGLLTPNIFTGGHNFHSKIEWVSLQSMEKTVDTLLELVKIWSE